MIAHFIEKADVNEVESDNSNYDYEKSDSDMSSDSDDEKPQQKQKETKVQEKKKPQRRDDKMEEDYTRSVKQTDYSQRKTKKKDEYTRHL